jgi:RNA polymerase sigma-70 factor (ECF subfamily)
VLVLKGNDGEAAGVAAGEDAVSTPAELAPPSLEDQIAAAGPKVLARVNAVIYMGNFFALDSEAIAQDVLAWGVKNKHKYDPKRAKILTWLYQRVESEVPNAIRANKCRPRASADSALVGGVSSAPAALDIDIARALDKLPTNLRTALEAVTIEGRTLAEAAAALRIPPGTMASWIDRAKAEMREWLAVYAVAPDEAAQVAEDFNWEPTEHERLIELASEHYADSVHGCAEADFAPTVSRISDYDYKLDTSD